MIGERPLSPVEEKVYDVEPVEDMPEERLRANEM